MSSITELVRLEPREAARRIVEARRNETGWLDELSEALDRRRAGQALGRILEVWGLSQSDASRLFGVSRQAVSKWLTGGVPSDRAGAVANLGAATDLLVRYLKRDRIPAVVRREAAGLDGRSLVDLVRESRTRDVLEACRAMFAFENVQA